MNKLFKSSAYALLICTSIIPSTYAQSMPQAYLVLINGVFGQMVGQVGISDSASMVSIPMTTLNGCEEEGRKWKSGRSKFGRGFRQFDCIEVK
ncbi:hypothetical protein WB44_01375 [Synechococcus sp. WH 8020]|jgi:hypothetical protein|nr:hypothetical protein WB44_01375 [Synechococcus sp. WH 8020]